MRRIAALALLLLICAPGVSGAQQQVDPLIQATDDAVVLQRYGIEFYRQNQPLDALAALRKALEIYPDNAETHMWLGVVYARLEETTAAEAEFQRALKINPRLTEVHNWYGLYWVNQGDLERALEQYRIALKDPAYPRISRARVLLNLGNALLQLDRIEEAIPALSEAYRMRLPATDPAYLWVRIALGEALVKTGRPRQALAVFDEVDSQRESPRIELLLGMAYRDLGETENARDHLGRVLRLDPGGPMAEEALRLIDELGPESR